MWNIRAIARKKIERIPKRLWIELRDIDGRLIAKGDKDYVLKRFFELNGRLGETHFFMPASWQVAGILASISGKK